VEENNRSDSGHKKPPRLKTNFISHQAGEMSAPAARSVPGLIVIAIAVVGVCYGLFKLAVWVIDYKKTTAMQYVDVTFSPPLSANGRATASVEIENMNPVPIKDTMIKFTIKGARDQDLRRGQVVIPQSVPAGEKRTFAKLELGAMPAGAGKLSATLADLKLGPPSGLSRDLEIKFMEAVALKDSEAVSKFQEIVEAAPDFAAGYVGLGKSLAAAGEAGLAQKAYRKAIRIDPDDANAHYNLGVTLFYQKKPEEAAVEFEAARALEPEDPAVLEALGRLKAETEKNAPGPLLLR